MRLALTQWWDKRWKAQRTELMHPRFNEGSLRSEGSAGGLQRRVDKQGFDIPTTQGGSLLAWLEGFCTSFSSLVRCPWNNSSSRVFFLQSPVLSVSVFIFCYQFIWNKVKSAHKWFHNASPSNHVYNTKNLSETEIERPGLHISVKYFESPLCMKCALKPPYLLIRKMIYCQSFHIAFQSQFCICIQMLSYFQSQSSDGLLPVCYWFPHSQKALVQIPARIFLCGVCTSSSFAYVGFLLVFSLSKKKTCFIG